MKYAGASAGVKEILILAIAAIALVLLLPKILAMLIRSSADEGGKLISDAVSGAAEAASGAGNAIVQMMPGATMPLVVAHPPNLAPNLFPTTPVGQNTYGIIESTPQSQPYVDYLHGAIASGTEGNGVLLTQQQETAFYDPVGEAQVQEYLKTAQDAKPWWQVW